MIAGKAVAFGEALAPEFADYSDAVLANARALGRGMESVSYTHLSSRWPRPMGTIASMARRPV